MPVENSGLGQNRPDDIKSEDDEYDAYRKRMMLAYRFRPNPLVSFASSNYLNSLECGNSLLL